MTAGSTDPIILLLNQAVILIAGCLWTLFHNLKVKLKKKATLATH